MELSFFGRPTRRKVIVDLVQFPSERKNVCGPN